MFLPVLMLRDYGAWGWILFVVPNIFGAAAMGWVLRDRDASRTLQHAHRRACRWFSVVTIAFHAYFALALVPYLIGDEFIWLVALMLPVVALLWGPGGRRATVAGALALAVSVLAMMGYIVLQGVPNLPPLARPRIELLWLAPVSAFGFLLAPYLDLTFHRARQSTTRAGGRTAFGLGFGVFFLLMIIFTALYAEPLISALSGARRLSIRSDVFVAVLAVHMAVQTAFTVIAHGQSVLETGDPPGVPWWRAGAAAAVIVAVALLLRWFTQQYPVYNGLRGRTLNLNSTELVYRVFLAFYGLVFPAYVWLFMVPALRTRRPAAARPPRIATIVFFGAVIVLAAPFFWMGFVEGRMLWLLPGVALVMTSRLLLPKGPPAAPTPAPAV
jgi:hypothetical protein